jgi:tight adherence protein C
MFEQLTQPENLLALLTAVGVFATILVIVMPMLATDTLGARMKSVALEREKLRARERARMANNNKEGRRKGAKKREPGALIKLVVDKLNLRKALADEKTEAELIQAGFRGQSPLSGGRLCRVLWPLADCSANPEETPVEHHAGLARCLGSLPDLR